MVFATAARGQIQVTEMTRIPSAFVAALPIDAPTDLEARLDRFVALLERWNRSIQLVATRDAAEIFARHVVDSLAALPHLPPGTRLVDVGSGGGFPGAVLALASPRLEVTALEPVHKKHAFLNSIRRDMGLPGFRPLAERDDAHRRRTDFVPYDAAISRAAFPVGEWLERGLSLVRPGGIVLGMEGRERSTLPTDTQRHEYRLGDRTRALLLRQRPVVD
jgi:16S rRNA (guanine527-N7)-methyltransferase